MLSTREKNYLAGTFSPSYAHRRVLDHRIRKKINEFYKELPLIQKFSVTENSNRLVNENSNKENQILIAGGMRRLISEGNEKRTRSDSNRRPNAPQAFALSKLCNESSTGTDYQIFKNLWY